MGNCLKLQRAASWADGREWEEEEEEEKAHKGTTTSAVGKMDHRVEVKIRVTKRQLQELLEKAGGGGPGDVREVEKVLAELMTTGVVCYHHQQQQEEEMMRGHWRPSLRSIPEAVEQES